MKIFLVFTLALVAVSQTVDALQCYQCGDYEKGETCPPEESWREVSCKEDQCFKFDGVKKGEKKGGEPIVFRRCADVRNGTDGCAYWESGGMIGKACFCSNENLCNGAFTARASIVGTLLLVALSLFLSN